MWIKRFVFALVALIIISVVGVAVFLLTFDPNAYKDKLEEFVYQRYERQLTIDGPIQLSLFPRIGLSVQAVRLSEKGSLAPFADVNSMRFSVAVWPLLWNRLVIDHMSLNGVEAWVEVDTDRIIDWFNDNPEGVPLAAQSERSTAITASTSRPIPTSASEQSSWSLLSQALAQPIEDTILPRLERSEFQVDIAGLDIQEVRINIFDRQRSWTAELTAVSINTGRLTLGQPFDLSLRGSAYSQQLGLDLHYEGQGVLQIEPVQRRLTAHRSQLQFSGQVGQYIVQRGLLRSALQYQLRQSLYFEQVELSTTGLWGDQVEQEPTQLSMTASSVGAYFLQPEFWLEKVRLNAQRQKQSEKIEFVLDMPDLRMSRHHTEALPVSALLRLAQDQEVIGLSLLLDGFERGWQDLYIKDFDAKGRYQRPEQLWQFNVHSTVRWQHDEKQLFFDAVTGELRLEDQGLINGFSARSLAGDFYIEPFNGHAAGEFYGQLWQPDQTTASAVGAENFNEHLNWFLWFDEQNRPAHLITHLEAKSLDINQWLPESAARAARQTSVPDTDSETSTSTSAAAQAEQIKPAPAWDWFALPVEWSWRIEAEQFRYRQLWLEQLQTYGQWHQKALEISELQAFLHQGELKAHLAWLERDQFQGYLTLQGVDAAALLTGLGWQPFLQGLTDLEATWYTQGTTQDAWLAQLNAELQLTIAEGALLGYSLVGQVDAANEVLRHLFAGQVPPMPEQFNEQYNTPFKQASAKIQGVNGQLQFQQLELSDTDYQLSMQAPAWIDLVNRQLDVNLVLTLLIDAESPSANYLVDFAQAPIPLRITGRLWAPELRLQWADMRHRFVQDAIEEGLLDVLGLPVHLPFSAEKPKADTERSMVEALVEDTAKYFGAPLKEFLQRID